MLRLKLIYGNPFSRFFSKPDQLIFKLIIDDQSMVCHSMHLRWIIFFLSGYIFISCDLIRSGSSGSDTDEIPFRTLFYSFQTDIDEDYQSAVLHNRNEAIQFLDLYKQEVPDYHLLLDFNYSDSLVVGVFTQGRPNNSYFLQIESVSSTGSVNKVQVTETGSAFGGRQVVWPAHFVVVNKNDFENREILVQMNRECITAPCAWQ